MKTTHLRNTFEQVCKQQGWSTDYISVNGKFYAYSDPDIDNMWIGWNMALKIAIKF